jgi:hypothetical protein
MTKKSVRPSSLRRGKTRVNGSSRISRKKSIPRTAEQYFAKPPLFQKLWDRVVSVVSVMRAQGTSLRRTSREMRISPQTVLQYGGSALRKNTRGRYQAKKSDTLLRVLPFPTASGLREIAVRKFRQASSLGHYWNAVQVYLETGDKSKLKKFTGKFITDVDGTKHSLLTDTNELDRLGSAGVLSFESLYGRTE